MYRKTCIFLIMLAVLIFSAGCWDRKEPENLAIVVAFGFDYNPENRMYKITAQIVNPLNPQGAGGSGGGTGGGDKPAYWTVSAHGYAPFEALNNLRKKVSREIHYSHVIMEIFSERMAREKGLFPFLDALERTRQTRSLIMVGTVKQEYLEKVLTESIPIDSLNALGIEGQIDITRETVGGAVIQKGHVFLYKLSNPGIEPIGVDVEYVKEEDSEGDSKDESSSEEQGKKPLIRITGLSVFKDDKMVGRFNNRETRGYSWIMGKLELTTLTFKYPGSEDKYISLAAGLISSRVEPLFKGG